MAKRGRVKGAPATEAEMRGRQAVRGRPGMGRPSSRIPYPPGTPKALQFDAIQFFKSYHPQLTQLIVDFALGNIPCDPELQLRAASTALARSGVREGMEIDLRSELPFKHIAMDFYRDHEGVAHPAEDAEPQDLGGNGDPDQ